MLTKNLRLFLAAVTLQVLCQAAAAPRGAGCPPVKLHSGRIRYRQKGRFVKFMCNTGFIIAGEKYSNCVNGAWDSPLPRCVRASCSKVNPPINGLIYPSHRGAVLNFFCKPGYELRGPNTTYCDGRSWDSNLPACIASNTRPALSCDFEQEDLCGWNHDLRHDFDWKRMNFRTPSGHLGTGPSFDHTKGEAQDGYYMYIESSSRNENDTARLISPIYDTMNDSLVCLEFFYHMHGASTGQLRVYLKKETDSWDLKANDAVFWRSGNHGDRWLRGFSQLGRIDKDFQIIIEGVRGSSYFSDIAVDDVRIIQNCTVSVEEATTESDVTYTDDYQPTESCLNRCDNDNLILPPTHLPQLSCGCEEGCIDDNSCCPDYIAVCVLGATDDFSTTTDTTTTFLDTTTQPPTTPPATKTTSATPKRNKTQITSNDINTVLKTIEHDVEQDIIHFPLHKYHPVNASRFIPSKPPVRKPTLIFLTPSTPAVIIKKLKPKIQAAPTEPQHRTSKKSVKTTTTLSTEPTQKPTQKPTSTQSPIDEILTVPRRIEDDRTYFPPGHRSTTTESLNVDRKPNDVEAFTNLKTQNQKVVEEKSQGTSAEVVVVIVASVSLILLVVLSGVFVARRYKLRGCRSRNKMFGSSSDSQSDVRFLTSDEMLDFNLATVDD